MAKQALLALADGSLFEGTSIGVDGHRCGEVVFNTSVTGYQEILTDPSYAQQIITFTQPHIGNVGVNPGDEESSRIWAEGLVVRDLSLSVSNWRSEQPLTEYLAAQRIVGIADVDTRRLTRLLRDKGAQNGCIMAGDKLDPEKAVALARKYPGLEGMDVAKQVSTENQFEWRQSVWSPTELAEPAPLTEAQAADQPFHVVAYDYGVKRNILRMLVARGCRVTVVPAQTPARDVLDLHPHGVFLSNGPGDPAACDYAITAIKQLLDADMPLFGICLGHQLLALASGANTIKMKFGHHGANHPVQDLASNKVFITSQNHGFTVDEKTLPDNMRATHRSLFDKSLQGIARTDKPAFSFQGHPEASPGPQDMSPLFDQFIELMRVTQQAHA